jgi:hypothetical protein
MCATRRNMPRNVVQHDVIQYVSDGTCHVMVVFPDMVNDGQTDANVCFAGLHYLAGKTGSQ